MSNDSSPFVGFDRPESNYFRLPNSWTDITADMKSLAELKVVEYVLRHTWGFQEYGVAKTISINEFMQGRRGRGGSRFDRGTGLSKQSVVDGIRNAVKHGYLVESKNDSDRGRIKKSYALNMRDKNLDPDVKILDTLVKNPDSRGEESRHRTKKETKERNTVNGLEQSTTTTPVRHLPDLQLPKGESDAIAEEILTQLGDRHSGAFYKLVATRVPSDAVRSALSEIKHDGGALSPAKVFTARMNRWAMARLRKGIG